jgi:DNA-binding NarL/FixJ family response regulator
MESKSDKLSSSARIVLNYIAEGHSYQQILRVHPDLTFKDIFAAAQEALDIIEADDEKVYIPKKRPSYPDNIEKIRKKYPNAYNPWKSREEKILRQMFRGGAPIYAIASALKRQPGAIKSRIRKLDLSR